MPPFVHLIFNVNAAKQAVSFTSVNAANTQL
jgi:hypothetical protein